MPLLLHSVHPAYGGVCNNALWTLGELVPLLGAQFAPLVEPLLDALVPILGDNDDAPIHPNTVRPPLGADVRSNLTVVVDASSTTPPAVSVASPSPIRSKSVVASRRSSRHDDHASGSRVADLVVAVVQTWCAKLRQMHNTPEKDRAILGLCAASANDFVFANRRATLTARWRSRSESQGRCAAVCERCRRHLVDHQVRSALSLSCVVVNRRCRWSSDPMLR